MRYTNFILTTSSKILSIQLICPLGMGSVGELCGYMCVVGEWVCAWVCIKKETINMSMTTYIFFNDVNTIGLVLSLKKFKVYIFQSLFLVLEIPLLPCLPLIFWLSPLPPAHCIYCKILFCIVTQYLCILGIACILQG